MSIQRMSGCRGAAVIFYSLVAKTKLWHGETYLPTYSFYFLFKPNFPSHCWSFPVILVCSVVPFLCMWSKLFSHWQPQQLSWGLLLFFRLSQWKWLRMWVFTSDRVCYCWAVEASENHSSFIQYTADVNATLTHDSLFLSSLSDSSLL